MKMPRFLKHVSHALHGWWDLAAALLLMMSLGLLWIGLVPAFQTPDEPDHIAYAERLSQQAPTDLRLQHASFSDALFRSITLTGGAAMLHDPTYKGVLDPEQVIERQAQVDSMSPAERRGASTLSSRAANNPPLQYAVSALLLRGTDGPEYLTELFLPRTVSLAMAMVALVFQFLLLRELFASRALQLLGLSILVLMPMYTFFHISPNPDNALGMFVSITVWLAVRAVRRSELTWRSNLGLALAVSGALLSKSTGAILVPVYAAVIVVLLVRCRGHRRRLVGHGLAFGAVATALAGWFYIGHAAVAAGEVTGAGRTQRMSFGDYLVWAVTNRVEGIFNEYWGVYGWLDTTIDPRLYVVAQVVAAVAGVGLVLLLVQSIRQRRIDAAAVVLGVSFLPLLAILVSIDFAHVGSGAEPNGFIQGRYFMPMTGVLVVMLVAGLGAVVRSEGARAVMVAAFVPGLAAFHVISLAKFVVPRYYL